MLATFCFITRMEKYLLLLEILLPSLESTDCRIRTSSNRSIFILDTAEMMSAVSPHFHLSWAERGKEKLPLNFTFSAKPNMTLTRPEVFFPCIWKYVNLYTTMYFSKWYIMMKCPIPSSLWQSYMKSLQQFFKHINI